VAYSPTGKYLAVARQNNPTIDVWEEATGRRVAARSR